jgi:hypothetical protein
MMWGVGNISRLFHPSAHCLVREGQMKKILSWLIAKLLNNLKVCDDGILTQFLCLWTLYISLFLFNVSETGLFLHLQEEHIQLAQSIELVLISGPSMGGIISQKIVFFITIAMKISNATTLYKAYLLQSSIFRDVLPCLWKSTDVLEECIGSFRISHTRNQQDLESPEDEGLIFFQGTGGLITDCAVLHRRTLFLDTAVKTLEPQSLSFMFIGYLGVVLHSSRN